MRKAIFFIALSLLTFYTSYAQTEKGALLPGGRTRYGQQESSKYIFKINRVLNRGYGDKDVLMKVSFQHYN